VIQRARGLTQRPFGVNLVLAFDVAGQLRAALESGVRIISFFWGDPAPWVSTVHAAGGVVMHTAGSAGEAGEASAAGVDVIVAQGVEAGGHVRGTTPLRTLLAGIRSAAPAVPVLAAGGIGDVQAARRALDAGADGVWLGSRFVASVEAAAHPEYKQRLVDAASGDTVLSTVFDIGWPDAPHRAIRNSTVRAWEASGRPRVGNRPGEGEVVARHRNGRPVVRYEDTPPLEGMTGDLESLPLYAGESVDTINEVLPAATIVERFRPAFRP
jgi:NAD(P)H-dependent flavin oxidoreductase YrpB (nitropropane dioxygenase family)